MVDDTGTADPKNFVCSYCGRSYSRSDHLSRHLRSHQRQKPYQCPTCRRQFTRQDLLRRHLASHSAEGDQPPSQHSTRVSQACRACASVKLKCDEEKPCGRCRLRGVQCEPALDRPWLYVDDSQPETENSNSSPGLIDEEYASNLQNSQQPRDILDFSAHISLKLTPTDLKLLEDFETTYTGFGLTVTSLGDSIADVARLDATTCDSLLSYLSDKCKHDGTRELITAAWPSSPVLDEFIQSFFCHQLDASSFSVHRSALSLSSSPHPLLLTAIISYGATLSDAPYLRKLGYTIQEVVQGEVSHLLKRSRAHAPETWLLQTFLCSLEVGFWSGSKEQIERVEGMAGILYRTLRKIGAFQRSYDPIPSVSPLDTGEILHTKWQQWIDRESLVRVASRAFILDAYASLSLFTNPEVRYTEMCLSLPCANALWEAATAEEWKSIYLSLFPSETPQLSLRDCLRDPLQLTSPTTPYYTYYSVLLLLSGAWAMVWETLHLLAQTTERPGHDNVGLAVRHHEVSQLLAHIHTLALTISITPCPFLFLRLDLIKMHLHICMEEIQLFAGRDGPGEAHRVLPLVQHWAQDHTSHQALWSAGQILRSARGYYPGTMRNYNVLAIYHAYICIWAHVVISRTIPGNEPNMLNPPLLLDGLHAPVVDAFLAGGEVQAGLTPLDDGGIDSTGGWVSITDVVAVTDIVSGIVRRNFISLDSGDGFPLLVGNVLRSMGDLLGVFTSTASPIIDYSHLPKPI